MIKIDHFISELFCLGLAGDVAVRAAMSSPVPKPIFMTAVRLFISVLFLIVVLTCFFAQLHIFLFRKIFVTTQDEAAVQVAKKSQFA